MTRSRRTRKHQKGRGTSKSRSKSKSTVYYSARSRSRSPTPVYNPRIGTIVKLVGAQHGEHGKIGKVIKKNQATKKAIVRLYYNGSDRVVPLAKLVPATKQDKKKEENTKSNSFDPYKAPFSWTVKQLNA